MIIYMQCLNGLNLMNRAKTGRFQESINGPDMAQSWQALNGRYMATLKWAMPRLAHGKP